MATTTGSHSVAAFTAPVNGTSPIDANAVRNNDNTLRSAYVSHDADTGIHVQSSDLASRPAAGVAGRKWMTVDAGVVRMWYDTGAAWVESGVVGPSSATDNRVVRFDGSTGKLIQDSLLTINDDGSVSTSISSLQNSLYAFEVNATSSIAGWLGGWGGSIRFTTQTPSSLTNTYALELRNTHSGAGNIGSLFGLEIIASRSSGGTVTNAYGISVTGVIGTSITNKYGIFVGGISGGTSSNFAIYTGAGTVRFGDVVNIASASGLQVNGTKVVGAQGATISDPTGGATIDAEARTAINTIIDRLQAHGLIA